ncbi:MAG: hypothetical protein AB7G37_07600 [Solirubrobacteraceae bacterium]
MSLSSPARRGLTLLVSVLLALTAVGCGAEDDGYTGEWDAICDDVAGAFGQFRTDVATSAGTPPDESDTAAARPVSRATVRDELGPAVETLHEALEDPWARVEQLRPPERWAVWHTSTIRRLEAHRRILDAGVRRVAAGDPGALALLALGGFGPAADDAPQALREVTPACARMR